MTFTKSLSQISKLFSFFGIAPYSFNKKTNKFECNKYTVTYALAYFLFISLSLAYIALTFYLQEGLIEDFTATFTFLTLLQQSIVMIIFYATVLDLIIKKKMHATFLNNLIELDDNVVKLNITTNSGGDLTSLHRQNISVVFIYFIIHVSNSIIHRSFMRNFEHMWNALQFFHTMSLTMVGYYIRCFAIILKRRCKSVFEYIDLIGREMLMTNCNRERIAELMKGFESFDEIINLKNQLSNMYGVQLLLNSAYDFIVLTITVYGILYYQTQNSGILYYFSTYNLPHAINCILLVLALDTLADQINELRKCALKLSDTTNKELCQIMDLIYLKITHMEKNKYVTANDYYPVNRSMLYGMGAAIVTHMMIIFQFQQWEDNQNKLPIRNMST